jgi:hypothetical protein
MAIGALSIGTLALKGRFLVNTSKKVLALGVMLLLVGLSTGCGDASNAADSSQAAQRVVDGLIEDKKQSIKDLMTRCEELEMAAIEKEYTPEWTQEAYYRFAVVEHVVSNVGEPDLGTSVHRRFLVNPIGEWYKIPESDWEWALTVKEGAVVELPATVMLWVKVDQTTVRYHGSYMIDALDGEHRSFVTETYSGHDEGIIFFVEKKDFEDRKYQ